MANGINGDSFVTWKAFIGTLFTVITIIIGVLALILQSQPKFLTVDEFVRIVEIQNKRLDRLDEKVDSLRDKFFK